MRILHVTDAYLPKQGGIEVQVHDLAMRQLLAGHQVEVLTCAPDRAPHADLDAVRDVPGRPGPRVHRVRIPWGRVRRTNAMIHEHYRRERPDVVHVHLSVLSPLAILGVRAAARSGVPVLVTLHSLWSYATPLYRLADTLLRWGDWQVHWGAVSELAAGSLRSILGSRAEVSVLPNGVEPGAWAVEPAERDPAEVVVVSVMRLAARKRPKALLHVVRRARGQLPEGVRLRVIVVGEGPLRRRLARDVARYGLRDVVELAGRMERDQIRGLYRRADVYIAPAILESFGIAALEARCAGVPVIARSQTGIADFIRTGEHGMLAATDAGLATALADLAADPQLRFRMAEHNRACAPETGWADVLQRCELAYKVAHELAEPRPLRGRAPARRRLRASA
jgi:glycosyltransferase involved in cell wall biosynthesis